MAEVKEEDNDCIIVKEYKIENVSSEPIVANDTFEKTNLRVTYLPSKLTEQELYDIFATIGQVKSYKMVRKRGSTDHNLGYAFVNYVNSEDAKKAIEKLNGLKIHHRKIKVFFAKTQINSFFQTCLYITGLPKETTEQELNEMMENYGKVVKSRILNQNTDGGNSMSQGVAYVYFSNLESAQKALENCNGKLLWNSEEPLRVRLLNRRNIFKRCQRHNFNDVRNTIPTFGSSASRIPASPISSNLTGYTIYVNNLPPNCNRMMLYELFGPYGAILRANGVQRGSKCFGFVTMKNYYEALHAIYMLNGELYFNRTLEVRFKSTRGIVVLQ